MYVRRKTIQFKSFRKHDGIPCLLSPVDIGLTPNSTVFLIGSIRDNAVLNDCLPEATPEP